MTRRQLTFCLTALGALSAVAGCAADGVGGYSIASLYREGVETVAVPIWTRDADIFRRDLELRLTEAVIKRIEADTPYRVAPRTEADTLLTGRIVQVTQQVLSFDPDTGRPRQLQVQLVVAYTWTDLRTGEKLVTVPRFASSGVYTPPDPFDEDFFLGSATAIDEVALRVVESMEQPW
ncbi:MAG: LPS assembly lipoprotein LptE [Planctomycetota bacterium]